MQTEIVQINSTPYKIWYESLNDRTSAIRDLENKQLTYGRNINIGTLVPTGPSSKIVGQTVTLTSNPTLGTAPYAYTFWKLLDTAPVGTPPTVIGTAVQASNTVNYTFTSSDIGPLRFGVDVQDSCPTGARTNTESWLVTVGPACADPVANLTIV